MSTPSTFSDSSLRSSLSPNYFETEPFLAFLLCPPLLSFRTILCVLCVLQDREALFEKMMSGPGIPATKFPRRGKPRSVVLTLVRPSGSSHSNMSSSSGGRGGAVGGVISFSSTASPSMLGGGEEMSPASLSSSVGHSRRGLSSTFRRNRLSGKASVLSSCFLCDFFFFH